MRFQLLVSLLALSVLASGQQKDATPRSIVVSATDTATADADTAIVNVGYQSFGATREDALAGSWEKANAITKALLDAGIPRDRITSTEVRVSQLYQDEKVLDQVARDRKFVMNHKWAIRVEATDAAKVLKIAAAILRVGECNRRACLRCSFTTPPRCTGWTADYNSEMGSIGR
jgi:uncharacterized protein YggE